MSRLARDGKSVFRFEPVGLDLWDRRPHQPPKGALVVKVQPGMGAPRNGTMGHVYVENAVTGEFHGLVLKNSLKKLSPKEAREALAEAEVS